MSNFLTSNTNVLSTEPIRGSSKDSRGFFSPRMEYDEWTPLGRGDPLKNDPTYDYVPPVLERVHYWIEPSSLTPDPPIATVGHASKAPEISRASYKKPDHAHREIDHSPADSRKDIYDPFFLKFVEGPIFSTQHRNQQHFYHHHYLRRPSSAASQESNNPAYIQRTHHYISPYHSYQQKSHQKQRPHENHPQVERHHQKQNHRATIESPDPSTKSQTEKKQNTPTLNAPDFQTESQTNQEEKQQQRPPYTILVPPPLQIPNSFTSMSDIHKPVQGADTNKVTTNAPPKTHVSVTQANLVYQDSSVLPMPEWEEGKTQLATLAAASSHVTWKSPVSTKLDAHTSGNLYNGPLSATTMYQPSADFEVVPSTELHFNDSNTINFPTHREPLQWSSDIMTTLATSGVAMTTAPPLTTDPLFSHYKQPAQPLRGPMYLIIQGHSKVKTYGAVKQKNSYHGIPLQESNDIHQLLSAANSTGKALEDYTEIRPFEEYVTNAHAHAHAQDQDNAEFLLKKSAAKALSLNKEDETPTENNRQLTFYDVISFDDGTSEEAVKEFRTKQIQESSKSAHS